VNPIVLRWRLTCYSCGRVLAVTDSYRSANGIWIHHKRAHISSSRNDRLVRPKIELIRLDGPGVDHE
jgi:hypothetical protein